MLAVTWIWCCPQEQIHHLTQGFLQQVLLFEEMQSSLIPSFIWVHLSSVSIVQYGKFHQITRCETTKKMKLSSLVQLDSNAEKIWNHKPYPKSTKQGRHWFCRFCHWIKLDIYCSYMCVCICNYMYISTISIRSPNSLDIRNERFHMTEPKITWAILHFGHKPIFSYPSIVIVIILRVYIYIYLFILLCINIYIEKCCSYIYIYHRIVLGFMVLHLHMT